MKHRTGNFGEILPKNDGKIEKSTKSLHPTVGASMCKICKICTVYLPYKIFVT